MTKENRLSTMGISTRFSFFSLILALVSVFGFWGGEVHGQTSSQNFGTGTGSQTSQTGSTAFIPNPTSGATWARAGVTVPNAPIVLATSSNPLGTTGAYVRGVASTSTSVSKFSPIVGYTGSTEFYTSYKVLFGDVSAGSTATTGEWNYYQGAGAMYSDASDFTGAQVFTGLKFTYGAGGTTTLNYRSGKNWVSTGLTTTSFNQATVYTIEIIGNNKTSGTISYIYNGVAQNVAKQTFDLFINGIRVGNDLAEAQLPANTSINSNTFTGISSASNVANIFVDDVVVYNSVPATIGTSTYLAAVPAALSGFNYVVGTGPSPSQSYLLSGNNLSPASGTINITHSTNYEASLDNITFGNTASVSYSGGSFADIPIYVRLIASLPTANYNGENIGNSGGGASSVNVSCSGNVSAVCLNATIPIQQSTIYTQDFNTLANSNPSSTVPCGWAFIENGMPGVDYNADNGNTNTGDTYSYGSTGNDDRAFGTLRSGSMIPAIGAQFTNSTGFTINSLTLEYTGEQWRNGGSNNQDKLQFTYSTNATSLSDGNWIAFTGLDFSSLVTSGTASALDGNLGANRAQVTYTITGLTIVNGATFWIKWSDIDVANNDDGLAVDDFSINASSTCPLIITGFSPASGPVGTAVTITGTNFTSNTSVLFDGKASTSVTYVNATTLIAIVPDGATYGQISVEENCLFSSSSAFNVLGTSCTSGATDLIISEYYEGTGNNKAIEIANFTGSPVPLSGYNIDIYANGSTSSTSTIALTPSVTLPNNTTWVVTPSTADASILALAQQTFSGGWFNGDDAVVLRKGVSTNVDILGNIGCDPTSGNPGLGWTDGGLTTVDVDLVRKASVINGVKTDDLTSCPFNMLATEWTTYSISDISHLGKHTSNYNTNPPVIVTQPVNTLLPACVGSSVTYTVVAGSGLPDYIYTWYYNTGAGNWISFTSGGNYAITNNATTSTLVISTIPIGFNNYQYYCEVSNPGGKCYVPSNAVILKLNPLPGTPVIGAITQPTCILSTGSVVLSGLPSGNWTINPGGITGTGISTTISSLAAGTYNFTVTNADGCTSAASADVVINAQPVTPAISPMTSTICDGEQFSVTPLNGTNGNVVPSGTTYSWPDATPDVAGAITNGIAGNGPPINGTLSNTTDLTHTITYIVTPVAGTCTGDPFTVTVTVYPTPKLTTTIPVPQTVCTGQTFNFTANSLTPNTSYVWSRAPIEGINLATTGSGTNDISEALTNSTTANIPVTYVYTLSANGCTNPKTEDVTVVVIPTTVVTASSSLSGVCPSTTPPKSMPFDLISTSNLGFLKDTVLLREDFELLTTIGDKTGPRGWTTEIDIPRSHTQFTIRQSPYTVEAQTNPPYVTVTINWENGNKFYISENLTDPSRMSSLISPPPGMNTNGYTTLTLDFWDYYRKSDDDTAFIQVSTDNFKDDITTVKVFTITHGYPYDFAHQTVNLSAFINRTNLRFRFLYKHKYDYYWAIDNVKVTGTSPITGFSWTASPPNIAAGFPDTLKVSPTGITQTALTTTYTAHYKDLSTSCPEGSASVEVIIHPAPSKPIITPKKFDLCSPGLVVALTSAPELLKKWELKGSTLTSFHDNMPKFDSTFTTSQVLITDISVTIIDTNGCKATSAVSNIIVNPPFTTNTIGAIQNICSGATPYTLIGSLPGPKGNKDYLWESSTTSATDGYANASGVSNQKDYSPGSLAQTTWYKRRVSWQSTATCPEDSPPLEITVGSQWTGATNSNWDVASNWANGCGFPTSLKDAVIPSVATPNLPPQVNITGAECKNLIIKNGASIQINPSQALTVGGNLTNNGTFTINSDALNSNGSLIVNGTSSGSGLVTYNRYLTPDAERWFIASSPVSGANLSQFSTLLSTSGTTYDFAPYLETDNTGWDEQFLPATTSDYPLTPGKGYLIRLKSGTDGKIAFTGALNNANVSIDVANTASTGTNPPVFDNGWNAVGNPFTSAIKITGEDGFIKKNTETLDDEYEAVYLWYQTNDISVGTGTGTYTGSQPYYSVICNSQYTGNTYNGVLSSVQFVQAGQGFLINSGIQGLNGPIIFNKGISGMQVHSPTATTMKSAEKSWPGITLLALNEGRIRNTVVAFNENMTNGLDPSYDAGMLSASDFNIYTHLVDGSNETDFMIQCLPDTWSDTVAVPIGIDMPQSGQLTFKAAGVILPDGLYPVIEDRLLQVSAPLKAETDSLTVDMAEPTWGSGRFYLHIGGASTTVGNIKLPETQKLSAYYSGQKIIVFGSPEKDSKAWLYDMSGRKLGGEYYLTSANRNEIPAEGLASGIYLLKIEGKTGRQTIKVTVLNR